MSRKKEKCRAQRNGSHQEREIELVITGHHWSSLAISSVKMVAVTGLNVV